MEFHVLGPVHATVDGSEVPLGGPRQRRLLAALVLAEGRSVSVDRLVDAVWGDEEEPPAGAARSVLSYVSRLRSALGNSSVATRGGGYALSADRRRRSMPSSSRDCRASPAMRRWRRRSGSSTRRCRSGTGGPSATWLTNTGAALPRSGSRSCAWSPWRRGRQARLDLGEHVEAIPELEQLVAEHPLRDSFRAELLLALFRSGRQADALRSFQEYRRLLGEETGLEPSRDLLELERRIAVADPALQFVTQGRTKRGYVLTDVLGEGSFGTVHRAIQPAVGREVAVKVVRPALADDPDFVRSFDGEARLVARLEHPHIVPLYDYWREPAGGAYLVMRYLRGGNLEAARREHRAVAARPRHAPARRDRLGARRGPRSGRGPRRRDAGQRAVRRARQRVPDGLRDRHVDPVDARSVEPWSRAWRRYASPEQVADGRATAQVGSVRARGHRLGATRRRAASRASRAAQPVPVRRPPRAAERRRTGVASSLRGRA